jgi:hypothetical protein
MIEVSGFSSCWTITFLNKSFENPTPTVWVCGNKDLYETSLAKLRGQKHIEIVQNGPSHAVV